MEFWIDSVYKFMGAEGDITIKFLEDEGEAYKVLIISGTGSFQQYDNDERMIHKTSKILNNFHWTRLRDEGVEVAPNNPVVQEVKRKRTRDEIEIDDLFDYVQRDIKMKQLWVEIDKCLEKGMNNDLFIRLSKEYAKLKAQQKQAIAKQKVVRR